MDKQNVVFFDCTLWLEYAESGGAHISLKRLGDSPAVEVAGRRVNVPCGHLVTVPQANNLEPLTIGINTSSSELAIRTGAPEPTGTWTPIATLTPQSSRQYGTTYMIEEFATAGQKIYA